MMDNYKLMIWLGIIIVLTFSIIQEVLKNHNTQKRSNEQQRIILYNDMDERKKYNQISKSKKWERIQIITQTYYNGEMNNQANQKILRDQYFTIESLDHGIIETYNILRGRGI